ncbi:MAG: hypothetical protein ACI9UQ_001869 [Candidatus Krumholzibacteriia bacterium]|jgi:hypothetical protein
MRGRLISLLLVAVCILPGTTQAKRSTNALDKIDSYAEHVGFFAIYWDEGTGRTLLAIEDFDTPFIYQTSLARGIGSNDLGLDRSKLGKTRLVEWRRSGPKVFLVELNLDYRANSDNPQERQAVRESFAESIIFGCKSLGEKGGLTYVDLTPLAVSDAFNIIGSLLGSNEGVYTVDAARSAIYLPRTKSFPDNTEIEATVTYAGRPAGGILRTVVPDAKSITVHIHHSFIRLPVEAYEPLPFDPRAGVIGSDYGTNGYSNLAAEVGGNLTVNYGRRHRLEKVDPRAVSSAAVEPIVYYVDSGVPEPVRSALVEGASWWNQAFTAAGYEDAFRVELLPADADPMDVRYNVIQWVHRSTRGWSYGASVMDPRTSEILKGHVLLGSLRVHQDYLIAEGLLAPYVDENVPGTMLEMSLARIRQLSAHEVGHTLGIDHNFAASSQDRASVMDYPFPLINFDEYGELDLSDAYGVGIGAWDKRVIEYAYQDFPSDVDDNAGRQAILAETVANFKFVADDDSRGVGTMHPDANLWDNGDDALIELVHLLQVRAHALNRFSEKNIRIGESMATLEEALVPIYLLHRFQIRAVSKLIGGQYFWYAMRDDGQQIVETVNAERQRAAMVALLGLLDPVSLEMPANIVALIPGRPSDFMKSREMFPNATGNSFDVVGPAESAVALTLAALLDAKRASRMIAQHAGDENLPGFVELTQSLLTATWSAEHVPGIPGLIQRRSATLVLHQFMRLALNGRASPEVSAMAREAIREIEKIAAARGAQEADAGWRALYGTALEDIELYRESPDAVVKKVSVEVPPGSPIGAASCR